MSKPELQAENGSLKQENKVLKQELEYKEFVISKLQKMLFGSTSERFTPEQISNQMSLFNELAGKGVEEVEKEEITYQRNKPKRGKKEGGRIPLPENLPVVEIIIEPSVDTTEMVKIRDETTDILDIIPPVFQIIRIIRPIYANPKAKKEDVAQAIIIANLPSRPIDKGIPSARLLAYLLVSKFVDHLPYYRQVKMFQRSEIDIKTTTINGWIAKTCVLLKPLYDAFCKHHFSKPYLQGDETTIKVLKVKKSGKKGKAHQGYYWVYYDPIDNQVVFIFDKGRGRKYPVEHLKNFSGNLQTDGLGVYTEFDKLDHVTLYGCMAHVRRKFFDALNNDKQRATKVLGMIQQLYKIEDHARKEKYTAAQRLELRQQKAAPIMTELKTYLDEEYDSKQVLPKSAIGIAIRYAIGQWWKIERYLEDGSVEIDNNLVENAIRPVALGRKNYLFAGSEQGAEWGAMIYTFLASATRHEHNPLEYLADVL
ncbi:MAG: IS66 family transposase, partial [Candidatus Jacksonbacteria bacterium]|nr:IS66 family transposase [Candidatus Jacksonbacteria bacterium]